MEQATSEEIICYSMASRTYPVDYISFSSVCLFNHNRPAWHKRYVLKIKDQKSTPAALVGTAFHKRQELFYRNVSKEASLEAAKQIILTAQDIDWGKTGTREKCLQKLDELVAHADREMLPFPRVVDTEVCIRESIRGIALPVMGYLDLICMDEDGEMNLIDWKSTASFEEELTPTFIVQAVIYAMLAKARFGRMPKSMQFIQIKASANSDGTSQVRTLVLEFAKHPEYFKAVTAMLKQTLREMGRKKQYLVPNLRDEYESETTWNMFVEQYK